MAITLTYVIQDGAIITHTMEGAKTKIKKGYGSAAHLWYDLGDGDHGTEEDPVYWDDLSDQDKLEIVQARVIDLIKKAAKAYLESSGRKQGAADGLAEYESDVEIEDE